MKESPTILVPSDSSAVSRLATQYAIGLAELLKARVVMASVVEIQADETVLTNWKNLEAQMMKSARKDMEKRLKEVKGANGEKVDVTYALMKGFPKYEVICKFAKDEKINLIVMGTKGASWLQQIFKGSNTAAVIGHSSVPVIVIPPKVEFRQIKRIVYATDEKNLKSETKKLASIANLFKADILILHVVPPGANTRIKKNMEPNLIKLTNYGGISYHIVSSDNVEKAINTFIVEKRADMLAMFTHKPDFYERLFNKSVTRKISFQSRIPLLTFNKTTASKQVIL